ncbi:MAG: hypothetical protein F6K65_26760 [Moorea sp. SIO3C2]|nr:hypothetical protein [Moorena sp. SIO3C2]
MDFVPLSAIAFPKILLKSFIEGKLTSTVNHKDCSTAQILNPITITHSNLSETAKHLK